MSFFELHFLILAQIGIDITIIIFFVFLIRRIRHANTGKSFNKVAKVFESLLADADKVAGRFKQQVEEKHHVIKTLNEQLDKRIISLNVLLNRADVLLSSHGERAAEGNDNPISLSSQQTEIIGLAKEGHGVEEIANMLSIPKGEVKLILDLREKFSQIGSKEGVY